MWMEDAVHRHKVLFQGSLQMIESGPLTLYRVISFIWSTLNMNFSCITNVFIMTPRFEFDWKARNCRITKYNWPRCHFLLFLFISFLSKILSSGCIGWILVRYWSICKGRAEQLQETGLRNQSPVRERKQCLQGVAVAAIQRIIRVKVEQRDVWARGWSRIEGEACMG